MARNFDKIDPTRRIFIEYIVGTTFGAPLLIALDRPAAAGEREKEREREREREKEHKHTTPPPTPTPTPWITPYPD